jgi:hypothetical protein
MDLDQVKSSQDRDTVSKIYKWSVSQATAEGIDQIANWDKHSPWHNSLFVHHSTGKRWVVYLPDQAWAGEVRVIP